MRAFVVLCLVAVSAAQYDYSPVGQADNSPGSAQLVPPFQSDPEPIVNEFQKEFYSYSAPEADFNDDLTNEQIANSVKRALRVVFIKGPENSGLENAALQLAKSASDDRTAIYVLNKQSDIGELTNKLNAVKNNAANKPEVHFVKYKTQADAENAQRTIQEQYDTLPGASSSLNVGSAPVLDFASKSEALANGYVPPRNAYLPPTTRF